MPHNKITIFQCRGNNTTILDIEEKAAERGLEKGIQEGVERVARALLKQGASVESVAEVTELSQDSIRKMKSE